METPKASRVLEQVRGIGDRFSFGVELVSEGLRNPEWVKELVREAEENQARRFLMQYIFLDRENPPLSRHEVQARTNEAIAKIDRVLGRRESVMFGNTTGHAIVFQKSEEGQYITAHFMDGMLRTMAAINLSQEAVLSTRVVMNDTHEGRIESSKETEHSLMRTAVHTFNFLAKRGTRRFLPEISIVKTTGSQVPDGFAKQIEVEVDPPSKLTLGEDLFAEINENEGRPLEDGGVLIIVDTAFGDPLASPFDWRGLTRGAVFPRYSEIDDFMLILGSRGSKLKNKSVVFGHTSRGPSFLAATQLAATVGATASKPVFPGYNPYLQHKKDAAHPIRPSPTVFAALELGRAKMAGKKVVLVDEAPTTDRVYATIRQLAEERGIDMSKVPAIFMVGVNINEEQGRAELINSPLNFNYSMGIDKDQPERGLYNTDTKRGFEEALGMFDDITLFTPQVATTGIPLGDFDKFCEFMSKSGNEEYRKIAAILRLRAREFASGRRLLEINAGQPLKIEPGTFIAQDTIIGGYLAHPEWFNVQQLPLSYTTLSGEAKTKDYVRVVTGLTEEGEAKFRKWLWDSIEENFRNEPKREPGIQFNVKNGYISPFEGPHTQDLLRKQPELEDHPDILPTFDVINPGQKTAVICFRGLSRRPVNERKGTAEFVRWQNKSFSPEVSDGITFVQVRYPGHTHHRGLLNAQVQDFLEGNGIRYVHIMGLSYGGAPAFDLAKNIHQGERSKVQVRTISLLSGLTNKQEVQKGLGTAWGVASKVLQGPRLAGIGIPSGWYAHTRGVAVRYEGIPDKPFTRNEMPSGVKVLLVGSKTDGIVDHKRLIEDVTSVYPKAKVVELPGGHDLSETDLWGGYRAIADFITDQERV